MKITIITLFIVAAALPSTYAQRTDTGIYGQSRIKPRNKLEALYLPTAPFLGEEVNVLDIFPWLEEVTRLADPEGVGIKFDIRVEDLRPLTERDKIVKLDTGPQILRISVEEYLKYLTKMADLNYTITADKVIITNTK